MSLRRSGDGAVRLVTAALVALAVVAFGALAVSSAGADNAGQLSIWGQQGTASGRLTTPHLMVADTDGSVFIGDQPEEYESLRLQKFSSAGAVEGSVTIPTPSEEVFPAIAIDPTAGRVYLLRDHEESDPETAKAMAETILVYSTTPNGSGELVAPAGGPAALPVPTGAESIDNPTELAVDPSNGELEIAGENRAGKYVLQRIATTGSGSIGARYTETTNSAGLNESTGGTQRPAAIAIEADGTTLILRREAEESTEENAAFTLPATLAGQPVPVAGFAAEAGHAWVQIEHSVEGFSDGFGPQIALSPDGSTLYFKTAFSRSTPTTPGNVLVRAFSLHDGGNYAVYGGAASELECTVQNTEAALAPVGEDIDVLDQGAEEAPSSWGVHLMRFGPGGGECPEPSAAFSLKASGATVSSVPAGTKVTLDGSASERGRAIEFESVTWKVEGPGGTFEQTVPGSDANPLTLEHTFAQEGTYTVRMSAKAKFTDGTAWTVFDAKPVQLVVTATAAHEPTVTAVDPDEGPAAGGNTVTVTGTNLTGATAVKFGAASATEVNVVSATELTAKAPAGTAGATVDLTVTTPEGTSATGSADHYTYAGSGSTLPTVTAVDPTHGPAAGGTTVTISGTNLAGATEVKFGNAVATGLDVVGPTELTANAPAGTPGATVDVMVKTAAGTSALGVADRYSYDVSTQVLTVTKAGNGSGSVTSAPAGISCGATCEAAFTQGGSVSLTAAAAAGSTFAGWGGACSGTGSCVVAMTAAKAVTATFDANPVSGNPPSGTTPITTPKTVPTKPAPKCKAGFVKKKVKGVARCVKKKPAKHRKHGKKKKPTKKH